MLDEKSYKAPQGMFRVIMLNTKVGVEDRIIGDYSLRSGAIKKAEEYGKDNFNTHVYDDQGNHIHEAGKF